MFAGGGSIPLEALRLGCEAYSVELNPVAHIIELCTLVYPQKYGSLLVADVKRWGNWVIERAKAQLAEFYPALPSEEHTNNHIVQTTLTGEQSSNQSNGVLTPIAYLWTRTVPCPNPTCGASVPLASQTWLRKKEGNYIALRMKPDLTTKQVRFERVQAANIEGLGFNPEKGIKRSNTSCLHCGATVNSDYVKQEGRAGRIGQQLMGVVLTKANSTGKIYLSSDIYSSAMPDPVYLEEKLKLICAETGLTLPNENINNQETRWFSPPDYGFSHFTDIFTLRQLLAVLTFVAEVRYAHATMLKEGINPERATAITTYLVQVPESSCVREGTLLE